MAEVDLGANLRAATETAYNNLVNDLNALDEGKASGGANGAIRPAIKVVAECGSVNGLLAGLVATGTASMPSPDERTAYYASITTRAQALDELEKGTQKLYEAIAGTAPDRWGETVQGPFGPATVLERVRHFALATSYIE